MLTPITKIFVGALSNFYDIFEDSVSLSPSRVAVIRAANYYLTSVSSVVTRFSCVDTMSTSNPAPPVPRPGAPYYGH
ncbi:hypothetical protein FS749_016651 [Ceratobasidium sp. UAMH 11750]|nr:hypothetical protein FS749_016651 [Ceratobasidium sp. UAMH 11750]